MMDEILLYFSIVHHGDWKKIFESIASHEGVDLQRKKEIMNNFTGLLYITLLGKEYPDDFKRIDRPPYVLFYEGNLSLMKGSLRLALLGSKHGSNYGTKLTKQSLMELILNEVTIVTIDDGGINEQVIMETMKLKGHLIIVLGSSIDKASEPVQLIKKTYSEDHWLIVSEYPIDVPSTYDTILAQQRLIAALAHGLVIIESKIKSPVMVAVSHALNEGKEIYCFPFFAGYESGCNYLIQQGAKLIESIGEVLEEYPSK